MGISSDGQLCFGVTVEGDAALPWDAHQYDGDENDWWMDVHGFKPCTPYPFTPEGQFLAGLKSGHPQVEAYYEDRSAWLKANPLPVEIVIHCSFDCPMWIIAVHGTLLKAWRGCPKVVDPVGMAVTEQQVDALMEFCGDHDIPLDDPVPKWWLSSIYG